MRMKTQRPTALLGEHIQLGRRPCTSTSLRTLRGLTITWYFPRTTLSSTASHVQSEMFSLTLMLYWHRAPSALLTSVDNSSLENKIIFTQPAYSDNCFLVTAALGFKLCYFWLNCFCRMPWNWFGLFLKLVGCQYYVSRIYWADPRRSPLIGFLAMIANRMQYEQIRAKLVAASIRCR